jgi:hypothetical protein
MSKRTMILAQVAASFLGLAVAGIAQVVMNGLVLHLDAGDNPTGGAVNPAEWGDISGANVLSGAGPTPARLTANPIDPRRVVDAVTSNAYYTVSDTGPANFGLSGDPPANSEPEMFVNDFTIELWLRRQGETFSGEHQIFGLRAEQHIERLSLSLGTGGNAPTNNLFLSEFSSPGFFSANGVDSGVNLPADGNFHHVVLTFDNMPVGTPPPMVLYLDNVATDLTAAVQAALQDEIAPAGPDPVDWIGLQFPWSSVFTAFNLETARRFNGDIAVVRVYDQALSAAEVDQNFNAGIPPVTDPLATVPDVTGLALLPAAGALVGANLQVGSTSQAAHPTIPQGQVIRTIPQAGTIVFDRTLVDLVISIGVGQIVPDVLGDMLAVASNAIVGAGLAVGTVTVDHNNDFPKDTVVEVDPPVGTGHLPGTPVDIVSSFGPLDYDTVALGNRMVISFTSEVGNVYGLISAPDTNTPLTSAGISIPGDGGVQTLFDPSAPGGVDTGKVYNLVVTPQP